MNATVHALTDKIQALSPAQVNEVEDFVDFLRIRGQDRELRQAATRMSEPVFRAIWNNADDDAYDAL